MVPNTTEVNLDAIEKALEQNYQESWEVAVAAPFDRIYPFV